MATTESKRDQIKQAYRREAWTCAMIWTSRSKRRRRAVCEEDRALVQNGTGRGGWCA